MNMNYPKFTHKYCVMQYRPFDEQLTVIGEFARRKHAKEFAEILGIPVRDQVLEGIMKHREDNGTDHGKFYCYPEYIFACRTDFIEDHIYLYLDDVEECILVEY